MRTALDDLLSLTERTYVRLEAEQLIQDCLVGEDLAPIHEMLEELVLAGSHSLAVLRELLHAVQAVKSDLIEAGWGIRQDLAESLGEFEVDLTDLLSGDLSEFFYRICAGSLSEEVQERAATLCAEKARCLNELCERASQEMGSIMRRLTLLRQLEGSVSDWMEGLYYEFAHSSSRPPWSDHFPVYH